MSSEDPRYRLDKLIRDSKKKGVEITKLGGSVVQWGQEIADLSEASSRVIQYPAPSGFGWDSAIDAWQHLNQQQDFVLGGLRRFDAPPITTSGSTAAYSMASFAGSPAFIAGVPPDRQDAARDDAQFLGQVLDKLAAKESVLSLLRQFGFDKAADGKKDAAEMFETAWAAFEKPVTATSPVITSLVPLRECIRETIEALLRRRPKQEATKNEHAKILSIGNQLGFDAINNVEIESLAFRWSSKGGLLDELSGSKDADWSREEWQSVLRRATLFLRELLQSLDSKKLR
jgi:hypothetical protein